MEVIADKAWWKSKTIWTSVVAGVVGVLQAAGVVDQVPELAWTLLASFGLYSVRDAVGKSNPEVK
jgi:esterase/lipase superfamily enzyme|tara:strand:- start:2923 stop:3117 length:195 start_codon:yes stop_codon:yes gene_type:complete